MAVDGAPSPRRSPSRTPPVAVAAAPAATTAARLSSCDKGVARTPPEARQSASALSWSVVLGAR